MLPSWWCYRISQEFIKIHSFLWGPWMSVQIIMTDYHIDTLVSTRVVDQATLPSFISTVVLKQDTTCTSDGFGVGRCWFSGDGTRLVVSSCFQSLCKDRLNLGPAPIWTHSDYTDICTPSFWRRWQTRFSKRQNRKSSMTVYNEILTPASVSITIMWNIIKNINVYDMIKPYYYK